MLVFSFQPSLQELTLTLGVNGPLLYRSVIVTFLSVYFQGVLQVERKLGGRLLDQPKQILSSLEVEICACLWKSWSRLEVQTCSQLSGKLFSFQGQISHFL